MRRWKDNPDFDIRSLEREAASGGAQAEGRLLQARVRTGEASQRDLARLRQLRGERVDPWEFDEATAHVGRIFLEACESWRWDGATARSQKPNRVEGRRQCFKRGSRDRAVYIPVTVELTATGLPPGETGLSGRPAPPMLLAWRLRDGEWRPGTRGDQVFGMMPGPDLFPCQGADLERFYVVPSSYPMYRNPAESAHIVRQEGSVNTERELHLQAVEWFVAQGAVRYVLPEDPEITQMRETRQTHKGLRTPEQIEVYLRWWDIYRQRVLVQVVNKQGARSFPGGWATDRYGFDQAYDHNSRILFPWMWNEGPVEWWNKDRVRLMKRVGKRWKNNPRELRIPAPKSLYPAVEFVLPLELKNWRSNPGDEGLRGVEREAAGGGLEEEARLLSARVRAGKLKRLQLQNAADLDYEPALMVTGHKRRGALRGQGWWNARGHRFCVTVLLGGFRTAALHAWGYSYTNREHSDDWWQAVAEDSTELFLAANFHPFYAYNRAKAWLDAGGRVVMTEGTGGYELGQAALAANTAGQIIHGTGRLPDLRTITSTKQLESSQQVCHAASSLLLCMRNDGQLGFHAKQCWALVNQAFWGVKQLPGKYKSLHDITLDFAIPRILK